MPWRTVAYRSSSPSCRNHGRAATCPCPTARWTHDLRVAREVDAAADTLGVSSSEVAIAWTMAHLPWVHPILGARTPDQLTANLTALDLRLPEEILRRLDEVSRIEPGFPYDFIESTTEFVYGPVRAKVLGRTERR
ncbi:hypothetical protein GCM10029978_012770 [Actinoallomurus acanthiterrae]